MTEQKSDIGWVGFYNSARTEFSESFKVQFSEQLEKAFNAMTGIENFAHKRGFQILVGMEDMKLTYKDGFGFGILELITPYSESIPQTFFWKSEIIENAYKLDNLDNAHIQIGFCADFKNDYFRSFKKRKIVRSVKGQRLNFKFIEELDLFPDITLSLEYQTKPTQEQLDKLLSTLKDNLKSAYISEITEHDGAQTAMIDFQGTEFSSGKTQIREFVIALNEDSDYQNISSVCFE